MKAMISYVLQEGTGHNHLSEIVDITEPPFTYSSDPPVSQVMKWAEEKKKHLGEGQELIIVNIFKL